MALLALLNKQTYIHTQERDTAHIGALGATERDSGHVPHVPHVPSEGFDLRHLSPTQRVLLDWGLAGLPAGFDAISNNLDKPDYVLRCFGALFRAAARSDPPWLWKMIDADPRGVLALAPHIGAIKWTDPDVAEPWRSDFARLGWQAVPGTLSWREWIEAARRAGELCA
jgi:hypothetical protein